MPIIEDGAEGLKEQLKDLREESLRLAPLQRLAGSEDYRALEERLIGLICILRAKYETLQTMPRDVFMEDYRNLTAEIRALKSITTTICVSFQRDRDIDKEIINLSRQTRPGIRNLEDEDKAMRREGVTVFSDGDDEYERLDLKSEGE